MTNKPSAATTSVKAEEVSTSLDDPHLLETYPESARTFLLRYNHYSTTVLARSKQITTDSLSTEAIKPVDLKFCVDPEFLESSIALGFIPNAVDYEKI